MNLSLGSFTPTTIEPICTFEASGKKFIVQKWYNCKTCNLINGLGMCEVCVSRCHKGHDIICRGVSNRFFCDCPIKCNCKCKSQIMNQSCTRSRFLGKPITQPMYKCRDCDENSYICQYCAIKHHHGHNLIYLGVVENKVCRNEDISKFSRSGLFMERRMPSYSDLD